MKHQTRILRIQYIYESTEYILMHIAAIYNLPDHKDDLAEAFADALGTTVYEARSRLRGQGNGPLVAASCREREAAEKIAERLASGGFDALVLDQDEIETGSAQFIVRKFRLEDEMLYVESREGQNLTFDYRSIDLLLRGTSIEGKTESETLKKRKFSLGMAMLSSGLVISRTKKITREIKTEEREGFFNLYSGSLPAIVFRESALVFESPGFALKPSRVANFAYLISELRQRQPDAAFDERLLRRAEQAALLGPLLSPEEFLSVAISLLAKILRQ
jgi:hypothetical protein